MSAICRTVKFRLFGFLKNVFRKPDANGKEVPPTPIDKPAAPAKVSAPAKPVQPAAPVGQDGNGDGVQIPLQAILAGLPLELRARVQQPNVAGLTVSVSLDQILSQLASGAVKVTFGQIRQAVPRVFATGTHCDRVEVILPLGEILTRLHPALLARRPIQKQVDVPAEIASPFGAQGRGLIISVGKTKAQPPAALPLAAPAPVASPVRPRSPFAPPPSAVPDQIFQRASVSSGVPASPVKPRLPISPTPTPRKDIAAVPVARAVRLVQPAPSVTPVTPWQPATPAPYSPNTPALSVSLSVLAQGWPEALRQEIVQSNLSDTRLALPTGLVEAALKRGRVAFAWKTLRSWIQPTPPANVSVHDGTELELPLSVLAPLFLARQKLEAKPQQRVAIDETIPNLFFGLPKPEPPPAPAPAKTPVNKVVDTNYYVWDDVADTARVDESEVKRRTATGTDFVVKYATPNEIVSRAAALDGVAGALIALPDGLMVASRIPPELNGDTLAAFLPQIFAKVTQTTRELRMGELNNLNFTVGNVPWKIFRVNAIFFAAFGRTGEPLPTGQLAALAAELDRKHK